MSGDSKLSFYAARLDPRVRCPDAGFCHHDCNAGETCWRTLYAAPFTSHRTWDRTPAPLDKP